MTVQFRGVIPPVVTPFHDDYTVDTDSLRRQVDRLIDAGVDGLFALGSSAEAAFLTRDNRRTVVSTIVDQADGRVPVTAGVIDMAPELPLLAYNIPVCVHVVLDAPLLIELAAEGVLAGVKDSGGVDAATRLIIDARNAAGLTDFQILTGSETTVDLAYLAGVDGVVPGLGNVDPWSYVELARLCTQGEWEEAAVLQTRISRLFGIATTGDPARMGGSSAGLGGFKAALAHLGVFTSGRMAPPHQPLDDAELATIARIIDDAELTA